MSVRVSNGPDNNNFTDSVGVETNVNMTGSILGGTMEAGEPTYAVLHSGEGTSLKYSVWYWWTPNVSRSHVVTITVGVDFSAVVAVYNGSSVSSLALVSGSQCSLWRCDAM